MNSRRVAIAGLAGGVVGILLVAWLWPRPQLADRGASTPAPSLGEQVVEGIAGFAQSPWSQAEEPPPPVVPAADPLPPAYATDRVMAWVAPGELEAVIADHGLRLVRTPGPSGLAALALPPGQSPAAAVAALRADPRVQRAGKLGLTYGAATAEKVATGSTTYQWHQDDLGMSPVAVSALDSVTVAVLDSGVAYVNVTKGRDRCIQAPTLAYSDVVAAYDFVNGDSQACDDHQHGTHIASLLASAAAYVEVKERGVMTGVYDDAILGAAAAVDLMPVKVLDRNNTGDEAGLIDGILHAVASGAQVINMSLSFGTGYVPSPDLLDALETAWAADVVMVAAAGNQGLDQATWPARSPLVVGVAATSPDSSGALALTSYTNTGTGVLVSAPGGDLSVDNTGDGYVDGLLAETIAPGSTSETGSWFMAGTSQASGLVAGVAARYVATGLSGWSVVSLLQANAQPLADGSGLVDGVGAGTAYSTISASPVTLHDHYVALLPYLADNGDGTVTPMARVQLVAGGGTVSGALVSFHGSSSGIELCTPATGETACTVSGEAVAADLLPHLWWVSIDGVVQDGVLAPARHMIYSDDPLQAALEVMASRGDYWLGWYWADGTDEDLGQLAESLTVVDMGSGFASSPMGLLADRKAVDLFFDVTETTLDLDGSGFASSPMGSATLRIFEGAGFASSPMGSRQIGALEGSGFASSPMGKATAVHGDAGGTAVPLDGTAVSTELSGTPVGSSIESGAWVLDGGYPLGEALVAASIGTTSVTDATAAASAAASCEGSVELTP